MEIHHLRAKAAKSRCSLKAMWRNAVLQLSMAVFLGAQDEASSDEWGVVRLKLSWAPPPSATEVSVFRDGQPIRVEWLGADADAARFRLPYGEYRLHLRVAGFDSQASDLLVASPEMTIRRRLELGRVGQGRDRVRIVGRAELPAAAGPLWVKLLSLDGAEAYEVQASPGGFFAFGKIPRDNYLVLVLRGDELIATKKVETRGSAGNFFEVRVKP